MTPNGSVVLSFFGHDRRIIGGPFTAYQPPAIGVCLDAHAPNADQAAIVIDIPDFHAPTQAQLTEGITRLLTLIGESPDLDIFIGCHAGLGRTGTLIAALAKHAGIPDPIAWTRRHYDIRAIETPSQEAAVTAYTGSLND